MDKIKVFISYSWKPEQNRQWVENFARRLSDDGTHVILDIWDLKEGQDKYHFMEQMVRDEDIRKVLLICNKEYAEKADGRKGGVGDESMIISSKIYNEVQQEKFIPIVREYNSNSKPYLPIFLQSRIYIDLSNEEMFETEYEKLIRNIFGKPSSSRPPIGTPPPYISIDEPIHLSTVNKIRPIKNALLHNLPNAQIFIDDFYESFIESLDEFVIENNNIGQAVDLDDTYIKEIERLKPLRDNYIEFLDLLFRNYTQVDIDRFHGFFEKLLVYKINYEKKLKGHIHTILDGSHIHFLLYELFLYTLGHALNKEKFDIVSYLVEMPYLVTSEGREKIEALTYLSFNGHNRLFEHRKKRLRLNDRADLEGETLKQRSTNFLVKFIDIQEADLLLYYISCIKTLNPAKELMTWYPYWLPHSLVYRMPYRPRLDRLISERFFEKFKLVFGVNKKEELAALVTALGDNNHGNFSRFEYELANINLSLKICEIGTYK